MIILETFRLAGHSLTANKLRSSLTMLGIAVGIFSVIGVMTAITALQSTVESGLNVLGANSFQIQKYPAINFSDPRERFANRPDLDYATLSRFKDLMGDTATISMIMGRGGMRVHYEGRRTNPDVRLIGTDENYLTSFSRDIALGRGFTEGDVSFVRPVVVIGEDVRKRLFDATDPVGEQVRIGEHNYEVVGVLAAKGSLFGQSQDNSIIVPVTRWLQNFGAMRRSMSVNVMAHSAEALPGVEEHAVGMMRLARGLEPEDANDFELFTNDSLVETFRSVTGNIAVGAFVISAIALVAAGVGVMNIMLVSVTERTREIGIRKSLGARKKSILTQFLLEAVVLSLLGGLFGIFGGIVLGNIAGMLLNAKVIFPVFWAAVGVGVCSAIGVGFGLYPAWKAASLDPIEALRFE